MAQQAPETQKEGGSMAHQCPDCGRQCTCETDRLTLREFHIDMCTHECDYESFDDDDNEEDTPC